MLRRSCALPDPARRTQQGRESYSKSHNPCCAGPAELRRAGASSPLTRVYTGVYLWRVRHGRGGVGSPCGSEGARRHGESQREHEQGTERARPGEAAGGLTTDCRLGAPSGDQRAGTQAADLLPSRSGRARLLQGPRPAVPDADECSAQSLHDSPQWGRKQMTAVVAPPPQPEATQMKVEKGAGLLYEYIT